MLLLYSNIVLAYILKKELNSQFPNNYLLDDFLYNMIFIPNAKITEENE